MANLSASGPGTPAALDGSNKFQHAISAWRSIGFGDLITSLDSTATEIINHQKDAAIQRKDLAQKTKDFRKMDDASKLSEIKGLLKAYQTFIDLIAGHSKSVNSAFLQAYTSLSEAPDPYPLLEASVDSMLVSEDTLPKVTEENERLQKSISKLTTQLEDVESRLEIERAAKTELNEKLESKVQEVEASWTAVLEERKDNWTAKEKSLEEKVESQERLISEMKASYEVDQRLGRTEQSAGQGYVSNAELEIMNADLERTTARLADVEARNEQMRLELAQAKSQMQSQPTAVEDDPNFLRMQSECRSLLRKLDAARVEKDALKRDHDVKLRGLEREARLLREEAEALKAKVQKWSDYEEVKQELEVLKSIEFSTGDDDDINTTAEGNGNASGSKEDTLERLLLARNKKLNDELTVLRVAHNELQARLADLEEEMSRTNAELEKAQSLNQKLEEDIEALQEEGANAFPSGMSIARGYAPSVAPTRRGGRISPTSSIISGLNPRDSDREPTAMGAGILPMITAQRDRFKKKNEQLEHELSDTHRTVSQLRQEMAALQKDNLNLYEKTRYISSYNRHSAAASSSSTMAYGNNPNPSTVSVGEGGTFDRYKKAYESNLSPFAAFRGRESARAYGRMSFPERAVYSATRMVLATRTSRNLFAAYCVGLHLLVFLCLYWLGATSTDSNSVSLGSSSVGAAAGAGGSKDRGWKKEDFSH